MRLSKSFAKSAQARSLSLFLSSASTSSNSGEHDAESFVDMCVFIFVKAIQAVHVICHGLYCCFVLSKYRIEKLGMALGYKTL